MFSFNDTMREYYSFIDRKNNSEPTLDEIAAEWNHNVAARAHELETETDVTYRNVIVPNIQDLLFHFVPPKRKVVDIGCGIGHLTNIIFKNGYEVTGIDIARRAIEYGKASFPDIKFEHTNIINFSRKNIDSFDACVANMVLHNLIDIEENLFALYQLLKIGGYVIASIPDPRLWLNKHVVDETGSFDYEKPGIYKVPFKIRRGTIHPSFITYIHRPIAEYNRLITNANFRLIQSFNPMSRTGQQDKDLLFCVWQKGE